MELVTEQVKYLRERRKELQDRYDEYTHQVSERRDRDSINESTPFYADYEETLQHQKDLAELDLIDDTLARTPYKVDRNFDFIDIGTAFYIPGDEDESERERYTLVESNAAMRLQRSNLMSLNSPIGQAVVGHKDGDTVSYMVNGRKIEMTILEIDRVREHYAHYICENPYKKRVCKPASRELGRLKTNDPEGYQERHRITPSQKIIVLEELAKLNGSSVRCKELERLADQDYASYPTDSTIGVGSQVQIKLTDENGMTTVMDFEYINQAVSYELEDHYVERISTLGHVLYGLKAGDRFWVPRTNQKYLRGEVLSVDNPTSIYSQRVR